MRVQDTSIPGVHVLSLETRGDERGWFARFFCRDEFTRAGLHADYPQINNSHSTHAGTLRGLHYQLPPSGEVKVLRCIRGAVWDVALDLRPDSPTFGRHFGVELTADDRRTIYVPRGCAHGFLTLHDDSEVLYMVSHPYDPERERGVRWDDPRFAIEWPIPPTTLSDKDQNQRNFDPSWHLPTTT